MIQFDVNVHVHLAGLDEIREIKKALADIKTIGETIMATLDDVLTEVTDENTRLGSIQTLIDGLKQQIADALSGATLPPAVQAKIDAVFTGLTANKAKIDTALNTGAPPPVVPVNPI